MLDAGDGTVNSAAHTGKYWVGIYPQKSRDPLVLQFPSATQIVSVPCNQNPD